MDVSTIKHRLLMFPWLAHGHITPFLELAKKLIRRNFVVYICTSKVNMDAFMPSIHVESSQLIQFVELPIPSLPELPPNYHSTKNLPPHLMNTLNNALCMAKDDFSHILETLKPDLIIYDYLQPWAPQVASSLNIPAVLFMTTAVAMVCSFVFLIKKQGETFPFPEICPRVKLCSRSNQNSESSSDVMLRVFDSIKSSCDVILINSFNDVEAKYIDFLPGLLDKKFIPIGPLVQCLPGTDDNNTKVIIEWIEKKEQASVLYVSFGSECYLTNEEIELIAKGLELSNVNFIWVIRFPEGAKVCLEEALPEGFTTRVGERGLVLDVWAPQARILAHPNTGGFLSHCGWNSVLEGMYFGVPIVAFPMHLDQPVNARVVEVNGCGIEVERDEHGKCQGEELARVIREVMVEKSGETVRYRAKELRDIMKKNMEEEKELDEAVKAFIQLLPVNK